MRWFSLTLLLFLLSGCATTSEQKLGVGDIHPKAPLIISEKDSNTLSVLLVEPLPDSKYVEVIFEDAYLGFFPIQQEVFIPNFKGSKQIDFMFSDSNAENMGIIRSYMVTR